MKRVINIPNEGIPNLFGSSELVKKIQSLENLPFTSVRANNREQWRKLRGLGASNAATIIGLTERYHKRRELFDEMRSGKQREFAGNDLTIFGQRGEPLIRAMWALEHPEYDVYDGTNVVFRSIERPWQTCSPDAVVIERETGNRFMLEIKTALRNKKWGLYCPDDYFAQICHQMAVTQFNGVLLHARIRGVLNTIGDSISNERDYYFSINNPALTDNIKFINKKEEEFIKMVESGEYRELLRF